MESVNMNYFFNSTYYDFLKDIEHIDDEIGINENNKVKGITIEKIINENNKKIENHRYNKVEPLESLQDLITSFKMEVEYPGLLIAIGNNHQANIKGEIALGFNFDYVTGLPYLPGSSLKGELASAFKYPDYILNVLKITNIKNKEKLVKDIFNNIFGDETIPGTDIFIDSFVCDYGNDTILKLDNLAPHRQDKKLLTLGEVNVLTMLKIAPGTKIKFNFILNNTVIKEEGREDILINKEQKLELFKEIIKDFGIGAKTNVGYGYLND